MNTIDDALPELSDERMRELEADLLARMSALEPPRPAAGAPRRRAARPRWRLLAACAAVLVVVAIAAPFVRDQLGGSSAGVSAGEAPAVDEAGPGGAAQSTADDAAGAAAAERDADAVAGAEIVVTADAVVVAPDAAAAAERIGEQAAEAGGYVAHLSVRAADEPADGAGAGDLAASDTWITVRVPAAELSALTDELDAIGTVESLRIDRSDVSRQARDLRARERALAASTERLTELLDDAATVTDLVEVEETLATRQAELDAIRSELRALEQQVDLSTLTVQMRTAARIEPVDATGFDDGLRTGWNAVTATVGGLVVAAGFALPWCALLAVITGVALAVRALVRRTRSTRRPDAAASAPTEARGSEPDANR